MQCYVLPCYFFLHNRLLCNLLVSGPSMYTLLMDASDSLQEVEIIISQSTEHKYFYHQGLNRKGQIPQHIIMIAKVGQNPQFGQICHIFCASSKKSFIIEPNFAENSSFFACSIDHNLTINLVYLHSGLKRRKKGLKKLILSKNAQLVLWKHF